MSAAYDLTEDQSAIREMARSFADEQIAPHAVDWDQAHHFAVDVVRRAAGLGMCGITVREDIGGSALTRLDAAVIMEALATGCPSTAAFVSIHNMVAGMVDRYGDDRQRTLYGPKLCSGEWLGSYCLTEPGCGSGRGRVAHHARRPDGDHYVLDGVKQFISGAGATDLLVVMARTGGAGAKGISAFLVEAGTPGPVVWRQREEDGLEHPAHACGDPGGLPRAGGEPARARKARGFRIAMAGWMAGG